LVRPVERVVDALAPSIGAAAGELHSVRLRIDWMALVVLSATGCAGAEEATRLALPVVVDTSGMTPVRTDLGYDVTLSEARLVIEDLEFTMAGEAHTASVWQRLCDLVIPSAHAHPGHYEGGDVTGELRGHFPIDLLAGDAAPLGVAELITGVYQSVNFTFSKATAEDGLAPGDPLLGHTALFVGVASKGADRVPFRITVDTPESRQLVGAPFQVSLTSDSRWTLGFELVTLDPSEGDTLFDGIDFGVLPLGADGNMTLDASGSARDTVAAYDTLRGTFMTHDHFQVSASATVARP
jgi:hypothetical protein